MREAEVEFDGFLSSSVDHTQCTLGWATGFGDAAWFISRILPTGATEGVAGKSYVDFGDLPPISPALPVLEPPELTVPGPHYVTFPVPASGGAYMIKFIAEAEAEVTGEGYAFSSTAIRMDKITVRFHR